MMGREVFQCEPYKQMDDCLDAMAGHLQGSSYRDFLEDLIELLSDEVKPCFYSG